MAAEHLETIGLRIRERREQLGLSRADVARAMPGKTNENQVYRWETGRHRISDDTLEALAKVLQVAGGLYFLAPTADKTETPDLSRAASGDALADRFDQLQRQVTDQLAKHAEAVEGLLKRQDEVLDRIEKAIAASDAAREQLREEGQAWAERAVALGLREFERAPGTQEVVPGTPGASE